jgi:hypothetical protein
MAWHPITPTRPARDGRLQLLPGLASAWREHLRQITIAFAPLAFILLAGSASGASFGGYECLDGCSGHAAGYEWAEQHGITESEECPIGKSESFHEGCLTYSEEPSRGSDEDDDGNQIDK